MAGAGAHACQVDRPMGATSLARAEGPRVPSRRCPRATRSTTRRTASGRCSRGTCRTRSRRRTRASGATAGRSGSPGGRCARVDAYGKHLFLRFEGGLTIHSHLRMTGSWRVYERGRPVAPLAALRLAAHAPRRARGPPVQRPGARADDRLAHAPGPPDRRPRARTSSRPSSTRRACCGACARTTRRARSATRCSTSARSPGSGTCGRSRAASPPRIDPWRPAGEVSDEEVLAILAETRPRMQRVGRRRRSRTASRSIYGKAGPPVPALRAAGRSRSRCAARATTTGRPSGARRCQA